MICPECECEYVEGITRCPVCQVALLEALPEEEEIELVNYEEILSTYNLADIAFIKSLLDGEGLDYHLRGETFSAVEPLVQPVKLMVREDQVETARDLLKELLLRLTGVSITSAPENEADSQE